MKKIEKYVLLALNPLTSKKLDLFHSPLKIYKKSHMKDAIGA